MSAQLQTGHESGTTILLREDRNGVATLTLNRPQQFNALSQALLTELLAALREIANDKSVRVVVLAGAGKVFCAGHDLKEIRANPTKVFQQSLFHLCSEVVQAMIGLPQPVIARVHGAAVAAGCQLVTMCDLAVAVEEARFAVPGVNLGLFCTTPAVGLSRNAGRKQAMEMLLTGDAIDAGTALARGLVNRVTAADQLDSEIARLTHSICAKSPAVIALGKKAFYQQSEMGMAAAYQYASEVMACNTQMPEAMEGIDAFIAQRAQRREP